MTALPTPAQGAPYTWAVSMTSSGVAVATNSDILTELQTIAANQAGPYNVQFLNAQPVGQGYLESSGSASALNAYAIPWTDVSNYSFIAIFVYGTYSGTLSFQQSPDNGSHVLNFNMNLGANPVQPAQQNNLTTSTNQLWVASRLSRYFAVQMTGYASGTANVILGLYTLPPALLLNGVNATQSGTWTTQPGNTPNTTPWLMTEANNNISVPSGAGNTVIKNAAGQLSTLVVTTAGTGAGNVQIFDNPTTNSGLVLHAFPATVSVAQQYQIHGWAKNGMTAQNVANGPVFTVYFS